MASTMAKFAHLQIPLEDVVKATNNFDHDNIIGHGDFGTAYKGKLLQSGELMMISARRLDRRHGLGKTEFFKEVSMLSDLKHPNIVSIIGFCDENDENIIVTTYEANGSLIHFLNSPDLTWTQRLRICVGVARALGYLHSYEERDYAVMHRFINSSTILLDENWEPKLSGFEISIKQSVHQKDQTLLCEPIGTIGYVDPAIVKTKGVTNKTDIYSFGVVLFEILCGRRAYIKNEANMFLAQLAKYHYENETLENIIHGDLRNQVSPESLRIYSKIAYSCLEEVRAHRPHIIDVVNQLRKAKKISQMFQPHFVNNLEHRKIHLVDIKLATNNFSDTYKIASCDGCTLYRAELDDFGKGNHVSSKRCFVIKRYPPGHEHYGEKEFLREIEILSSIKHPNIVTLLGFCVEGYEMILVTENVSHGNLGDCLGKVNGMRGFNWEKRLKISIDVAHALKYLHFEMEDQKMIINRDICSYNIVLDESSGAKILYFGDSVFLPPNQEDKALYLESMGRSSYIDPEYEKTHKLKRESDVYGFGVVLFEILCGRLANNSVYIKESANGLAHVARQSYILETLEEMIDPIIKEEVGENKFVLNIGPNKDSLHTFIEIANKCVAETQDQRPTMKFVVDELEKALSFQENKKDNPRISLEEIKEATNNFHHDNCIGGGGFGRVFKGDIQDGNEYKTIVAKRLDTSFGQGEQQFLTELQILLQYKHDNLIGLVGYCDEQDEKIIVFDYASRGSLDRHLKDASLTWVERLNICIDVASTLDFLHGGVGKQARVIHRDIKSSNILVNHHWKAKLADFGLSLISSITQKTEYVIDYACGTPGYLDPVYEKSRFLTTESDIYSFGVVLFEILCGRSTFEIQGQKGHYMPDFIKNKFEEGKHGELVFEQIREQIVPKSLAAFQTIAYQCLHHDREKRPATKRVLMQLKKAMEYQNMASTMTKFAHLQIPLEDVVKATNNFDHDNIIKHSEFATTYRGVLLRSGRSLEIAAQRFDSKNEEADLEFLMEISVLYDLKQTNLVSIVGFSDEKDDKIIVTTYTAKGSLGQYLNNPDLTWTQRLRISVGVARALSYLHQNEGRDYAIIHCNINSDAILLDENWEAKLSGFEMSIKQSVYNKDQVYLCEHIGTMGCMDPEIEKMGGVTHKSDIYSFGVVLFEMLCGRKAFVQNEVRSFQATLAKYHNESKALQDIIYPDLHWNRTSLQSLLMYSNTAYSCLREDQVDRPNMSYIVDELEKAWELQLRRDNIGNNLGHLKIPLADIKFATEYFSESYRIASCDDYNCTSYKSAYGQLFYKESPSVVEKNKGTHSTRLKTVVIKQYHSGRNDTEEGFLTEVEMLANVKHPNIVTLLGFCVEDSEMILVTEDFSNGYLADYLRENQMRTFTWEKRLKICIDVAHALNYLHSELEDQKMIINRRISSYSIRLDANFGAKIVDFWSSVFLPPNQDEALYLDSVGKLPYIDPEYKKTRKLKRESDVYSFGVVLLEILSGRIADDPIYKKDSKDGIVYVARRHICKGTQQDIIDPTIKNETHENSFVLNKGPSKDSLDTFIEIAYQCVAETQDQRPTMEVVVKKLEKALSLQENYKDNPRIPLEAIKQGTQNFHDDSCIGGEGYWKVYKGNLQNRYRTITIVAKRLDMRFGKEEKQFLSELQILQEYKHKNVIGLVGYCDEHDEKIILYEYASRKSLDRYLSNASLTWVKRLSICIDVANALDFIHGGDGNQAKVIHGDIKTTNVLLNHDWKAKVTGFGLSLISPITPGTQHVINDACGTPGYVDPLYRKSGFLTIESDVYSFGVVLFEILCGGSTFEVHKHLGYYLPEFIKNRFEEGKHNEVVFEQIKEQIVPVSLTIFQRIAYECLHHEREKRPAMKRILTQLKKALRIQKMEITFTKFDHLQIPLKDVVKATNNFHDDNYIQLNGFGKSYKGQLMRSGRLMKIVAQKFDCKQGEVDLEFLTEIAVLSDLKHTNVVSLIGFCNEKDEKIIITTYETKRRLRHYLDSLNLTWTQRLKISVGVARALSYLHYDKGRDYAIIHCNIDSDTIVLDKNMEAKLSGFEISIKQSIYYKDEVSLSEHIGTMGCTDPAIEKTGGVTHKSDIYSFGVVLFELMCGSKDFIQKVDDSSLLAPLAKYHYDLETLQGMVLPGIRNQMSQQSLLTYAGVAYSCKKEDRAERPNMDYIVAELETALEHQLQHENDARPFFFLLSFFMVVCLHRFYIANFLFLLLVCFRVFLE